MTVASPFEHLRGLPGPVRVADFAGYVRALGIEAPWTVGRTFQGMPMRHRNMDAGSFFLAEKADGEAFSDEDEEVLALFASRAATAIAKARAHRRERRARADLEAVVETSPVGVVVFDAKSGRAVSFNREARRIVESLRLPGHPPEQLLEVMSFRRADGREVSLSEFPMAQQLSSCETVRVEEMVLSVPDGRSGRALVKATPIQAEGGAGGSVVVTVQDLAPLEEIERLRTRVPGPGELRAARAARSHQGLGGRRCWRRRRGSTRARRVSFTASSPSRPTTCAASSATCWTPAASRRARSRSRPSRRRWPTWWSARGARS